MLIRKQDISDIPREGPLPEQCLIKDSNLFLPDFGRLARRLHA